MPADRGAPPTGADRAEEGPVPGAGGSRRLGRILGGAGARSPLRSSPDGVPARILRWVRNAVQLSSDRDHEGQEAFTASPFDRLAVTQALSMAGDALVTLALAGSLFFNISPHAARGRVALSLVLTMAPFAVVAPFLGPIIDRTTGGRRMMVVLAAVGRTLACLMMARYIHGLLLFPAAFVTLVCSKAYVVAKAALVPAAVERPEDLIEANAKLAIIGAVVGFLAAIPGVAILKLLSAATLLRVDCLVFILCGLSALRIQPARPGPAVAGPDAGPDTGRDTAGRADQPPTHAGRPDDRPLPAGVLQLAAAAVGSLRFSVGFLTFLVAFAFRRSQAPAWWYGVVLAASVGGNLVGAVLAPRLRGRVREEHILAGAVAAVALTGVVVMQLDAFNRYPSAALLAAVLGIGAGSAKLAFDSLVQREVPAAVQGRAFARFEAMFQLVWVVGGLVPVVIAMSLQVGFVVGTAVTGAAVAVYEIGSWLGRRDRLPAWWPGAAVPHWPTPGHGLAVSGGVGAPTGGTAGGPVGGGPVGGPVGAGPAGGGPAGGPGPAVAGPMGGVGAGGPFGSVGPVGPTFAPDVPTFGPVGPRPVPPPLSGPHPIRGDRE